MNSLQEIVQQFIHEMFEIELLEKGFAQTSEEIFDASKRFALAVMKEKLESVD